MYFQLQVVILLSRDLTLAQSARYLTPASCDDYGSTCSLVILDHQRFPILGPWKNFSPGIWLSLLFGASLSVFWSVSLSVRAALLLG